MFYEHAVAYLKGEEVEYEEEPPPLPAKKTEVTKEGHRVYSK